MAALSSFGAPLAQISERDLTVSGTVVQIGVPPRRIDILTAISGVEFSEAWNDRIDADIDDLRIPVISRDHLLQNKRATGRAKDLVDVGKLEQRKNP